MKNVHLLPNEKYSLESSELDSFNMYITSDEYIRDVRPHKGKWHLEDGSILNKFPNYLTDLSECKLVIMTTDPKLIEDGVQSIDDNFLKYFQENSIEYVIVETKTIDEIEIELNIHGHDIGLTESEYEDWLKGGGKNYTLLY